MLTFQQAEWNQGRHSSYCIPALMLGEKQSLSTFFIPTYNNYFSKKEGLSKLMWYINI